MWAKEWASAAPSCADRKFLQEIVEDGADARCGSVIDGRKA